MSADIPMLLEIERETAVGDKGFVHHSLCRDNLISDFSRFHSMDRKGVFAGIFTDCKCIGYSLGKKCPENCPFMF